MRYRAGRINRDRWVSPFGNRRVKACSQLTDAYRSVPRPSSPVCAKASTNCPYLTLESPHHQRHHWVPPKRSPTRQSSARWPLSGADDYNLSQIILYDDVDIWSLEPLVQIADAEALTNRRSNPRLQNRAPHGIDFKKPIHNVKYGSSRPNHRALARRTVSLHL